ncbi:MAG TPA: aldo/keto reductase [Silvibacterium sp.]|nr:aldo/keto reductase [Verrucomicrobiota bacterium]HTD56109.1 aldo/keto reductase [Silvibacterium sp.]
MNRPAKTFKIGGDLEVNRLGFGAMRLTGNGIWGEPKDVDEAKRVLKRAVELGVNFIDTADSYGPAVSERLIGEALAPFPKGLVVATKGGLTRQGPNQWLPVGRTEYLAQQVEMSLRFLKTEVIDLWQLHRIDPKVPVEESLGVIAKLQQEGKIRHVGLSEVKPAEIERARKVIKIVSVQNLYNVGDRQHEDVLEYCEKGGLGFIPWFPVAAGKLAQPGGRLDTIAKHHGATVAQLSIAWLLHRSPVMLPIPGTSSTAHLEENIKAAEIHLSDTELGEIESAAR